MPPNPLLLGTMDDLGPFWDDDTLTGEITSTPHRHDLFDVFADSATLDEVVPEPDTPPFMLHPPSPPQTWRTFLDDNCPFRRRVKVTICNNTPPTVSGKRPAPDDTRLRKRARTTLQFPPQFCADAPFVPRRARSCAPDPESDALLPLPDIEPVMLDPDGIPRPPTNCSHDGYLTPKLQSRLAVALAPNDLASVMSTSRVSSSTSSSSTTSTNTRAKLPCVSAAVAAVRQAATAYCKLVNTGKV